MQKFFLEKIFPIGFVLLLAFIAVKSLLQPGLPPTHDGEYHVIRFYEFDKALRGGQWYPRWAPDLNKGYGIPLFNYVYPLPNYISAAFHAFGISFIDSFKLNMAIATLIGAVAMYLWAKIYWGQWGGVVSAVFYTYAPYHFLDIYIRGSVGEVWALALFPVFLWSITLLSKEKNSLFLPISSLVLALVVFSHNILAVLFFPFAVSYMFLLLSPKVKIARRPWALGKKRFLLFSIFLTVLLSLGLSAIFWLPAILEKGYVWGLEVFDYRRHFVELYQLIFPSWGSGFSSDESTEGLSFQIGIANLTVLSITILILLFKKQRKQRGIVLFIIGWIILSVFLMLPLSLPVWNTIAIMQYFQFPWRMLSLVILCCAFLAGSLVPVWQPRITASILVLIAFILGVGYAKPAYYHMRDDDYYTKKSNFIDGTNSPGNAFNTIWFNEKLPKATAKIEDREENSRLNIAYFPGWKVLIDGQIVESRVDKDGLIQIAKPKPEAKVMALFDNTAVRAGAQTITLISFFVTIFLLIKNVRARMGK